MAAVQLTPEWLELEKNLGGRMALEGSPDEMLAQYNGLVELLSKDAPPPDPDVAVNEQTIDGVRCLVFKPKDAGDKKLPVCIYTHGGGFMLGSPEEDAPITALVAKHTPAVVISVDYRLSPKHKHPAALEDTAKVYKWAWHNADSFGGDQGKFFSMGGSAGGGLALSVANKIVGNPETRDRIKGVVAIVPVTVHPDNVPADYQSMYKSYTENAKDVPVINGTSMRQFYDAVDADPKDAANFVALDTENHKYFPPTYFSACEADPLRDDAYLFEKMLSKAGVKTKLDFYKHLPHYFWIFSSIPEGAQHFGNMLQGVKFVLES